MFDRGSIEDSKGYLHADFANRYIGGGVLHGGCVQEEIMFGMKPELIASMVFCDVMEDNEAIELHGSERFSEHTGYGSSVRYNGPHRDSIQVCVALSMWRLFFCSNLNAASTDFVRTSLLLWMRLIIEWEDCKSSTARLTMTGRSPRPISRSCKHAECFRVAFEADTST